VHGHNLWDSISGSAGPVRRPDRCYRPRCVLSHGTDTCCSSIRGLVRTQRRTGKGRHDHSARSRADPMYNLRRTSVVEPALVM
jgi:hypothetical protein